MYLMTACLRKVDFPIKDFRRFIDQPAFELLTIEKYYSKTYRWVNLWESYVPKYKPFRLVKVSMLPVTVSIQLLNANCGHALTSESECIQE